LPCSVNGDFGRPVRTAVSPFPSKDASVHLDDLCHFRLIYVTNLTSIGSPSNGPMFPQKTSIACSRENVGAMHTLPPRRTCGVITAIIRGEGNGPGYTRGYTALAAQAARCSRCGGSGGEATGRPK
jgi:hypothetical protein